MASSGSEATADLCVLGSGIAGMLLAERAIQRGRRVLMLERGTAMTFEERRRRNSHADPLPFNASPHRSRQDPPGVGPRTRWDSTYVFYPIYNLGGSTNHFYGNMPRFHPQHFEREAFGGASRRWPVGYGELEPHYLQAERRLSVSGSSHEAPFPGRFDYPLPPHRLSPSDRACRTIFDRQHVLPVPTVRPSQPVGSRPRCCGTDLCGLCPIDSKGTALNTIYPSIREHIELRTGLLATELHCRAGRVEAVTAMDAGGRRHLVRARQFVMACNGIDSCLLLQRSPTVPKHPSLGRYYMDHPCFELAVSGAGLDARPGYGDSAQTGMITAFFEQVAPHLPVSSLGEIKNSTLALPQGELSRDVLVQDIFRRATGSRHSQTATLRGRFRELWRGTLDLWFMVETQPHPENTVSISRIEATGQAIPEVKLRYPPYFAACVRHVVEEIQRRAPGVQVKHIATFAGSHHWLGATRMALGPDEGCVDASLRYFGLENLHVLSASVFPSSSSANPTLTLSALALRLGDHLGGQTRS